MTAADNVITPEQGTRVTAMDLTTGYTEARVTAFRVLVTGSRTWTDRAAIETALLDQARPDGDTPILVHGACPSGADAIAAGYAASMGWTVEAHPANWREHGTAAGFRRNAEMVAAGADVVLAFIRDASPGATHCARLAARAGIPVQRWTA